MEDWSIARLVTLSGGELVGRGGGGGHDGRGGGISSWEKEGSKDESGMSCMITAGCAEHSIPGWLPQITPLLLGVGPSAVLDMGEVLDTVTPFIVTSVGALISSIGTAAREGGGAGTRG